MIYKNNLRTVIVLVLCFTLFGFSSSADEVKHKSKEKLEIGYYYYYGIDLVTAAIVPHNAMADSLMDDISLFVEENTEAETIDEEWEIQ